MIIDKMVLWGYSFKFWIFYQFEPLGSPEILNNIGRIQKSVGLSLLTRLRADDFFYNQHQPGKAA
jgi:hypothetical protein